MPIDASRNACLTVARIASEVHMTRDIIIHYDEAAGKIVCSTVAHELAAPLLEKALPLETSIEFFKGKTPEEAERSFGAGLFALLDLSADPKIGIRDYGAQAAVWATERDNELAQRAAKGDGEAQYERAMALVTEGMRAKSKKKMQEADALLQLAASSGHAEAMEYLADLWPALKLRANSYK